jgi:ankyrin repeat protein
MKTTRILLCIFASLALSVVASPQSSKSELNDQLFEAVRKGDAAAVTALLDKGADVNAKFRYGATALFKAAERGHVDVVKVLLARGADVKVTDTFYGTTAMSWALQNNHFEVVRAIVDKSAESVDEVLLTGARGNQLELVRIATDKGGTKPDMLTRALEAALTSEPKNEEIIALLKKSGAVPPAALAPAVLESYPGKYKGDPGPELNITQKDGRLYAQRTGQPPPLALMAIDQFTFVPIAFDSVAFTFKVEDGKPTAIEMKQGSNTTLLKRQ